MYSRQGLGFPLPSPWGPASVLGGPCPGAAAFRATVPRDVAPSALRSRAAALPLGAERAAPHPKPKGRSGFPTGLGAPASRRKGMHPPRGIPDRPWRPCPDRAAGGAFGPSRVPEVQHVLSVGARRKTDRPFGGRAGGCTPRDPSFVRGARGRSTGDQWGRGPLGVPVPSPRWPLQGVGVGEGVPPTPSSTSPAVGSMHPPSRPAAPFRAEGPERPAAGEASPGPEPRGWIHGAVPVPRSPLPHVQDGARGPPKVRTPDPL